MADPPPDPPTEPPPFVAGLPDAPLERPSDFPDYDGPLVCPFYGPDHPARRDEESTEAFNEDVARVAFGNTHVNRLQALHSRTPFAGDWWVLLSLLHAMSVAEKHDPQGQDPTRFGDWDEQHSAWMNLQLIVHLEFANLDGADLAHANLLLAHLEHVDLSLARADHADFRYAHLEDADLELSRLSYCDLSSCFLQDASLNRACLDYASIRSSHGVLFDDNQSVRLNIEGNAPDPWSTLRRTYTGPMFFVHLLLLVAFLLPYAAKVLTLTTTARGYEALRQSLEAGEGVPPGGEVVRAWLEHFDASHTQTHAAWVLLGGTHAWWWAMVPTALAILCYNVLRGHLTLTIGVLRDQADRVERTPRVVEYCGECHPQAGKVAGVRRVPVVWRRHFRKWRKDEYRWRNLGRLNPLPIIGPWHLHQLARVLFWISIASVVLHVGAWLWTTTVPVPK